jgi:DmsE family decaheme c-type cytochrome
MNRFRPGALIIIVLGLMGAGLCGTSLTAAPFPDSPIARDADAPAPGTKTCLRCHEDPKASNILHTAHGMTADQRTGFGEAGCTTCHGESLAHQRKVAEGSVRARPDIVFGGPASSSVELRNSTCLGCHEGGLRHEWAGSLHQRADLTCADCHAPHLIKDPILTRTAQPDICFTCHKAQRALSLKPSHHPIREGAVICSDCHNPHGTQAPHLLKAERVTETCLTCHAEKRGPFLWEHPPVSEDCTTCHDPHGSVQANLLKQRVPYLCQSCHDSGAHVSLPLSGNNLSTGANPSASMSLRGCVTCHTQIHGSNHPGGIRQMR